jgi:hypothetical protein
LRAKTSSVLWGLNAFWVLSELDRPGEGVIAAHKGIIAERSGNGRRKEGKQVQAEGSARVAMLTLARRRNQAGSTT